MVLTTNSGATDCRLQLGFDGAGKETETQRMTWSGSGGTRAWRRCRSEVLKRDGYQCQYRLPGCLGDASEVDHTINLKSVGRALADAEACDPDLCASICSTCHKAKTARESRSTNRHQGGKRTPSTHPSDVSKGVGEVYPRSPSGQRSGNAYDGA